MSVNNNQLEPETITNAPSSETETPENVIQGVASYTPEGDDTDVDNVPIQSEVNLPTVSNTSRARAVSPFASRGLRNPTYRSRSRRGGKSTRKRKHTNAKKTRRQSKQNRKTKRQRK